MPMNSVQEYLYSIHRLVVLLELHAPVRLQERCSFLRVHTNIMVLSIHIRSSTHSGNSREMLLGNLPGC